MPLPTGGAWPPETERPLLDTMREHAAWYSGNTDQLAKVYSGKPSWTPRASQYAGGVVGAVARWFWGTPADSGQKRTMLHLPLAADIATASADLLFADPPSITFDDPEAQARFNDLREATGLDALLVEAAEICSALGGVYLRVGMDSTVSQDPFPSVVWPDQAVPEFRWGRLVAVTFWQELSSGTGRVLRHLERHEPGRVYHGLYEGSADNLGSRIGLDRHPVTAPLAKTAGTDGSVDSGVPDRLAVVYIPNMRPNRRHRTPHGRSDYDGIESTMDAIDRALSSWMRDIDLGKGRLIVPHYMLQSQGAGKGATFDPEREVFEGVNIEPGSGAGITVAQFAIRVEEHSRTVRELMERAVSSAGYSVSSFGFHGESAQATATEVEARKERSNLTRDKKIRYWDEGVTDLVAILMTAARQPAQPRVEFPETVQADQLKLAQAAQALRIAEAASTRTLVRMQHPDWDDTQVNEEVALILEESGRQVEDPATFTGLPNPSPLPRQE